MPKTFEPRILAALCQRGSHAALALVADSLRHGHRLRDRHLVSTWWYKAVRLTDSEQVADLTSRAVLVEELREVGHLAHVVEQLPWQALAVLAEQGPEVLRARVWERLACAGAAPEHLTQQALDHSPQLLWGARRRTMDDSSPLPRATVLAAVAKRPWMTQALAMQAAALGAEGLDALARRVLSLQEVGVGWETAAQLVLSPYSPGSLRLRARLARRLAAAPPTSSPAGRPSVRSTLCRRVLERTDAAGEPVDVRGLPDGAVAAVLHLGAVLSPERALESVQLLNSTTLLALLPGHGVAAGGASHRARQLPDGSAAWQLAAQEALERACRGDVLLLEKLPERISAHQAGRLDLSAAPLSLAARINLDDMLDTLEVGWERAGYAGAKVAMTLGTSQENPREVQRVLHAALT